MRLKFELFFISHLDNIVFMEKIEKVIQNFMIINIYAKIVLYK